LYQRDRGELDWDAQSMTSTVLLGDNASIAPAKSNFYADGRAASPAPSSLGQLPGYDKYMTRGPQLQSPEYEMARFDSNYDKAPLLGSQQQPGYADSRYARSSSTLVYQPSHSSQSAIPQYPGMTREVSGGPREAPVHRPQPTQASPSSYQGQPPRPQYSGRAQSGYSTRSGSTEPPNMAGRGAHRA
jgi:hypothetical protein